MAPKGLGMRPAWIMRGIMIELSTAASFSQPPLLRAVSKSWAIHRFSLTTCVMASARRSTSGVSLPPKTSPKYRVSSSSEPDRRETRPQDGTVLAAPMSTLAMSRATPDWISFGLGFLVRRVGAFSLTILPVWGSTDSLRSRSSTHC